MKVKVKGKEERLWNVEIGGSTIRLKETELYKYLGIYRNRNGNVFRKQLEELRRKGQNRIIL